MTPDPFFAPSWEDAGSEVQRFRSYSYRIG